MQSIEIEKTRELEQKFDPEMRFRPIRSSAALFVTALLIVLSRFHFYTAVFGLLSDTQHRGVQPAFVLGPIFPVLPMRTALLAHPATSCIIAAPQRDVIDIQHRLAQLVRVPTRFVGVPPAEAR